MSVKSLRDLTQLPRTSDSWTFLYAERVRIERVDSAIELRDKNGRVPVPIASLSALLLGPGSVVTHAAVAALAESGCSAVWCGEGVSRFYAGGAGETRSAHHIEAQAKAWADPEEHLRVVKRLYAMRFTDGLSDELTIEQIRGHEGVRVRDAYARISKETGVKWSGRDYKRNSWGSADPINRAISAANACLYGLCHAAIVATGFSPALGFLHVGKQLSFVYDVADLYKVDLTLPLAFQTVAEGPLDVEARIRRACRQRFYDGKLLERIVPDLQRIVGLAPERVKALTHRGADDNADADEPDDAPGALWDGSDQRVGGGHNYGASAGKPHAMPGIAKTRSNEGLLSEDYTRDPEQVATGTDDDEVPF